MSTKYICMPGRVVVRQSFIWDPGAISARSVFKTLMIQICANHHGFSFHEFMWKRWHITRLELVNTLRLRQNSHHLADVFKCIFLNENVWILLNISLKFVPMVRINNIPSLVQIMAWRRSGDKPLSEPMMVILLTRICVTRPQWAELKFNDILFITDTVSKIGSWCYCI